MGSPRARALDRAERPPAARPAPSGPTAPAPVPASGGWLPGDPVGGRQFLDLARPLTLAGGGVLPDVRLAYETWGRLAPDGANAVLVLHALTGDSHLAGPVGPGHPTPGWWSDLLVPGGALDPARWFVVVPNAIGGCQGSTGPATAAGDGRPWGSRFPDIALRDLVTAEAALADALGIARWAAVVGGSLGGMRALEWAAAEPDRVQRLFLLATSAAAGADLVGSVETQVLAIIQDPNWHGGDYHGAPPDQGPHRGLGLARRIAHLSYRAAPELAVRFGRTAQPGEDPGAGGRYAVESYLDHHADKLVRRFDAGSYVTISRAMRAYDVGAERGGTAAALAGITARTTVAGIDSDRLFPLADQQELADGIPGAGPLAVVHSAFGHDGFLIETVQVGRLLSRLLGDG